MLTWSRPIQAAALVAALVLPSVGYATQGNRGLENLLADAPQVVEAMYDRLAAFTITTPAPLAFRVHDVDTFRRDELESVLWNDQVSGHQGDGIDVLVTGGVSGGLVRAVYKASWEQRPEPSRDPMAGLTVAQAIAWLAEERRPLCGDAAEPVAMTGYWVEVALAERSRDYPAVMFWCRDPATGAITHRVLDHVTERVAEAAADRRQPLTSDEARQLPEGFVAILTGTDDHPHSDVVIEQVAFETVNDQGVLVPTVEMVSEETLREAHGEEPRQPGDQGILYPPDGSFCCASETRTYFQQQPGFLSTAGHYSGSHQAHTDYRLTCVCDTGCSQSAVAEWVNTTCSDTGVVVAPPGVFHKIAENRDSAPGVAINGLNENATAGAGAGFICGKRDCVLSSCNFSVKVSISIVGSGGDLDFTWDSGGGDWGLQARTPGTTLPNGTRVEQWRCPKCRIQAQ